MITPIIDCFLCRTIYWLPWNPSEIRSRHGKTQLRFHQPLSCIPSGFRSACSSHLLRKNWSRSDQKIPAHRIRSDQGLWWETVRRSKAAKAFHKSLSGNVFLRSIRGHVLWTSTVSGPRKGTWSGSPNHSLLARILWKKHRRPFAVQDPDSILP